MSGFAFEFYIDFALIIYTFWVFAIILLNNESVYYVYFEILLSISDIKLEPKQEAMLLLFLALYILNSVFYNHNIWYYVSKVTNLAFVEEFALLPCTVAEKHLLETFIYIQ